MDGRVGSGWKSVVVNEVMLSGSIQVQLVSVNETSE
jgi:hypothetical protein